MRIYLDNCCFNRPYDDQSQIRISLETQAKLYVQNLIKERKLELVTSYVLWFENSRNPYDTKKLTIAEFIRKNSMKYVDIDMAETIKVMADEIIETGIKVNDAYHVACAIWASCDCFLTTDKRLLKYRTDKIELSNPVDFLEKLEGGIYGK